MVNFLEMIYAGETTIKEQAAMRAFLKKMDALRVAFPMKMFPQGPLEDCLESCTLQFRILTSNLSYVISFSSAHFEGRLKQRSCLHSVFTRRGQEGGPSEVPHRPPLLNSPSFDIALS